jgi:hypothetical protein
MNRFSHKRYLSSERLKREFEKQLKMTEGGIGTPEESEKVFKDMNESDIFSSAMALQESLALNQFLDEEDDDEIMENMFASSKPASTT